MANPAQLLEPFVKLFAPVETRAPQNDTGAFALEEPELVGQPTPGDEFLNTLNPFQKDFDKEEQKKKRKGLALKLLAGMFGGGV